VKAPNSSRTLSESLDEVVARRVEFLTGYQSARYAKRYRAMVERMRAAETGALPGSTALTEAAARSLFKLMAYKDEYEVARLYTNGHFERQVASTFAGENLRYEFHLAPPLFARKDPTTGLPRKMSFGPWMMKAFRVLARLRSVRGTPLDVFGYTLERKTERRLVRDFERVLEEILGSLTPANHTLALGLANMPQKIRGFGHIKERNLKAAEAEEAELLARFRATPPEQPLAAAAE
jgi:indolepyruvate ferredoxin oxidoreductase